MNFAQKLKTISKKDRINAEVESIKKLMEQAVLRCDSSIEIDIKYQETIAILENEENGLHVKFSNHDCFFGDNDLHYTVSFE